jgi:mannose-6-phosphate isomerase
MGLPSRKPAPRAVDLRPFQRRVEKPWGWEIVWAETKQYTGKLIHVLAGHRLSLQYHEQKLETQCLLRGSAVLLVEDGWGELLEIGMETGKGYTVHPFQIHRLCALEDADILEVSEPERGTTVRLEDDYGRPDETDGMRLESMRAIPAEM